MNMDKIFKSQDEFFVIDLLYVISIRMIIWGKFENELFQTWH